MLDINKIVEEAKSSKELLDEKYLFNKWQSHIGKGWYGFDLGNVPKFGVVSGVPNWWYVAIDNTLDELKKIDENFEIHQIKLKFGGLRFYVDGNFDEGTCKAVSSLEEKCFDKELIF